MGCSHKTIMSGVFLLSHDWNLGPKNEIKKVSKCSYSKEGYKWLQLEFFARFIIQKPNLKPQTFQTSVCINRRLETEERERDKQKIIGIANCWPRKRGLVFSYLSLNETEDNGYTSTSPKPNEKTWSEPLANIEGALKKWRMLCHLSVVWTSHLIIRCMNKLADIPISEREEEKRRQESKNMVRSATCIHSDTGNILLVPPEKTCCLVIRPRHQESVGTPLRTRVRREWILHPVSQQSNVHSECINVPSILSEAAGTERDCI